MIDPYVYPGTDTLINKFGIKDENALQDLEAAFYHAAATLPLPSGELDFDHLKSIHKYYFGDLYDWAGQVRSVDISKGDSFFARKEFIRGESQTLFNKLKAENYLKGISKDKFCQKLSYYFNELNAIHPFREGNGRTLRGFCDILAEKAGYSLNWENVQREQYIHASIQGFKGNYDSMTQLFQNITHQINRSQELIADVVLDKDIQNALKAYVEKECQLLEMIKQKNIYLSQPDISKEYADKAHALKRDIKALSQQFIKHEKMREILTDSKNISVRDQGGFEAIHGRLKKEELGQKDLAAVLRNMYNAAQSDSQSQRKSSVQGRRLQS